MKPTPEFLQELYCNIIHPLYHNGDIAEPTEHTLKYWQEFASDDKVKIIHGPRGSGKTTAGTITWIVANILLDNAKFIVIVGDSNVKAFSLLREVKNHFKYNRLIINRFGRINVYAKSNNVAYINYNTRGEAISIGRLEEVRSLKWGNLRPDHIVFETIPDDRALTMGDVSCMYRLIT